MYSSIEHANMFNPTNPRALFPVYGIKHAKKALFANITEGDAYARITVNPAVAMAPVQLNRVSFEFIYRHQYRIYLTNIVSKGQNLSNNQYGIKLEKDILSIDHVVTFSFLEGDDANYSGMANVYRAHLLKNELLNVAEKNRMTLALQIFMADKSEDALFDKVVAATTFADIERFIKEYADKNVDNLDLILKGWTKSGYSVTPQQYKPSKAVGGRKGLSSLESLLSTHDNVNAYLELNITDATKNVKGFRLGRDTIQHGNQELVTNAAQTKYLLRPETAFNKFQKAFKALAKYSSYGLSFADIGTSLYHDSNPKKYVNREETKEIWQRILKNAADRNVAVSSGALYTLAYTDFLYDVPLQSSKNVLADEDIPWYSMVVHGSIPFSTVPANLFYDFEEIQLRWVEYGSVPTFEITDESPTVLRNTEYNRLFTSKNSLWQERIIDVYSEMKNKLDVTKDAYIVKHEKLSEDVVFMAYSNGYQAVINYSEKSFEWADQVVPGRDFVVFKGGIE